MGNTIRKLSNIAEKELLILNLTAISKMYVRLQRHENYLRNERKYKLEDQFNLDQAIEDITQRRENFERAMVLKLNEQMPD